MIRGWENLSKFTGICVPTLVRLVRVQDFPKPVEERKGFRKTFVWNPIDVDAWQTENEKFGRTKSTLRFTSQTNGWEK